MPELTRPGPPAELLAELPEAQASGEQRHIYAQIKRLSAVPMVALIYRHLATIPGALEWAWALVGPALQAGWLQQRAWQLAVMPGFSVPTPYWKVKTCGLTHLTKRPRD